MDTFEPMDSFGTRKLFTHCKYFRHRNGGKAKDEDEIMDLAPSQLDHTTGKAQDRSYSQVPNVNNSK